MSLSDVTRQEREVMRDFITRWQSGQTVSPDEIREKLSPQGRSELRSLLAPQARRQEQSPAPAPEQQSPGGQRLAPRADSDGIESIGPRDPLRGGIGSSTRDIAETLDRPAFGVPIVSEFLESQGEQPGTEFQEALESAEKNPFFNAISSAVGGAMTNLTAPFSGGFHAARGNMEKALAPAFQSFEAERQFAQALGFVGAEVSEHLEDLSNNTAEAIASSSESGSVKERALLVAASPLIGISKTVQFLIPKSEIEAQATIFAGPLGKATMATMRALGTATAWGAGSISKATRASLEVLEAKASQIAGKDVQLLTAGDLAIDKSIASIETFLNTTAWGAKKMFEARKEQLAGFARLMNAVSRRFKAPLDKFEAGSTVREMLAKASREVFAEADRLYAQARGSAPSGKFVIPRKLLAQIDDLLSKEGSKGELASRDIVDQLTALRGEVSKFQKKSPIEEAVLDPAGDFIGMRQTGEAITEEVPIWDLSDVLARRSALAKHIADADAHVNLSRELGSQVRGGTKGVEAGVWKKLYGALQEDLSDAAVASGRNEFIAADAAARAFYKNGRKVFENKHVLRALRSDPERLVDYIVGSNTASKILAIKKAARKGVTSEQPGQILAPFADDATPEAFNLIKANIVKRMMEAPEGLVRGAIEEGGEEAAKKIPFASNFARQWRNMEQSTKRALFEPQEIAELDDIAKVAGQLGNAERMFGNTSGTARATEVARAIRSIGKLGVRGASTGAAIGSVGGLAGGRGEAPTVGAGAVAGALAGSLVGVAAGGGMFLAPYVVAKMYLSRTGRALILDGLKTTPGTQKAAAWTVSLGTYLASKAAAPSKLEDEVSPLLD